MNENKVTIVSGFWKASDGSVLRHNGAQTQTIFDTNLV
ncbi:hypothetical protein FOCG_05652 [Fusarium oxysporum f. sp. radicis-lycopersici 26381]|uniref:Uncharacterized protein n=3 Tax=Fusarium oxysporum TaxID=5507 RepID=W9HRE9_FUSOX|nr:hypothetical protein FOYG_12243 [Fusarium oxysporum NRRL 32931]EWZ35326.1 hypothetical protein FOZG_11316 [Fusarium oxysporum Fo47]EWZ96678.1 hypothetical protein FOWG_03968 [Fusarium oxysporum f. sp. lycopersici MN25]EXK34995.1 hypothetical protein FOMG_10293 [Fusarium oxysporum f. sp. melonis 26406]EXL54864.1 hypothetical protein FOCG_05652 [Fusarium oxysporum f. sp. radicis-lycopersici 26381]